VKLGGRGINQLWKEQLLFNPSMPNRGQCFMKIPEYVAKNERQSMKKRLVAPLFLVTVVLLGAVFTTKIPIDVDSIAGNKKAKPVRMSGKLIDPGGGLGRPFWRRRPDQGGDP